MRNPNNDTQRIVEMTIRQMPNVFTSNKFNRIAIKNGYSEELLKQKGLSRYIREYAKNGSFQSKTWVKFNSKEETIVTPKRLTDNDELNQKYLTALKAIYQGLKYSDKINLSKLIEDFGLSKDIYKPLQDGGIIKTNGKAASGCRYTWTSKEPCIEMAIELRDRVNRNSVKRKPKETLANKPTIKIEEKAPIKTTVKSYFWGLFTSTITTK
jgi:hypothetical protein